MLPAKRGDRVGDPVLQAGALLFLLTPLEQRLDVAVDQPGHRADGPACGSFASPGRLRLSSSGDAGSASFMALPGCRRELRGIQRAVADRVR